MTVERCPKCGAKLYDDTDEVRAEMIDAPVPVQRCIVCGFRQYPEIPPALAMTAEMKMKHRQDERGQRLSDDLLNLVKRFADSISGMRSTEPPTSWRTIESLIRQATGRPIKYETIQKYYAILQEQTI